MEQLTNRENGRDPIVNPWSLISRLIALYKRWWAVPTLQ